MTSAIQLDRVSVTLGKKVMALRDVSVKLPAGQIIGVIGPSGAGKTTLIRVLAGRQRLTSGSATIFGLPVGSPRLRQQLSYMTQEVSVYSDLTVRENLAYFATIFGAPRREADSQIGNILQTVDLEPQANRLVERLSGGQKQRVSLAVALVGSPKLLLLDEPTVGLDPVLRQQLWELFARLAKSGITLVISSHVMDEAERCDDLLLIRDGAILAHGSPAELRQQTKTKSVEDSFLKLVGEVS